MKRFIIIAISFCVVAFVIIGISFGLFSCKPTGTRIMDQKHYDIGKSAVEIVDAYLEFKIIKLDAIDRLDKLYDDLKELPETDDASKRDGNDFVRVYVSLLSSDINYSSDAKIIETRNELATELGLPKK